MTRESLLLVSSRHSKREPRISRACDETQERHSREPLESGDLSSKRTLALLTRLSRKKEKRATFVRCDELIFFFLFSSSRRTRPSLLYTRSFDAYVVDFSSFSRRTERGGGPMHETASTSLFFTEQPIVTFKKRNCVIVVSHGYNECTTSIFVYPSNSMEFKRFPLIYRVNSAIDPDRSELCTYIRVNRFDGISLI